MVIVPALNEEGNISSLVRQILQQPIDFVVVADNGSNDETAAVARSAGALVVTESRRGYGYACAAGSAEALARGADILVYIDGDHSSQPDEMERLLEPILSNQGDLVLGSRVKGQIAPGAMHAHQRWGNTFSTWLLRRLSQVPMTDQGPYRAIRASLFERLAMEEMTFGWPTEMTLKSAAAGGTVVEVPVTWSKRQKGRSKVSGTVKGSVLAGYHIIRVILRHARSVG